MKDRVITGSKQGAPFSWASAKVGEILPLKYGKGLVKAARVKTGTIPVYGSSGVVGFHTQPLVRGPSLIVGRKGSVGTIYLSNGPSWPIDTTYYIEGSRSTNLAFFHYLLGFLDLGNLDKSTAIPGLSRSDYNEIEVSAPPLPEQHRIVAEIEKQLTRLDAAIAALERVRANLKRYRASVLKTRLRGPAGPDRGGACPRPKPRLRACRPAPAAHPRRAPRPLAVPAQAPPQVQCPRPARHVHTAEATRRVDVELRR